MMCLQIFFAERLGSPLYSSASAMRILNEILGGGWVGTSSDARNDFLLMFLLRISGFSAEFFCIFSHFSTIALKALLCFEARCAPFVSSTLTVAAISCQG